MKNVKRPLPHDGYSTPPRAKRLSPTSASSHTMTVSPSSSESLGTDNGVHSASPPAMAAVTYSSDRAAGGEASSHSSPTLAAAPHSSQELAAATDAAAASSSPSHSGESKDEHRTVSNSPSRDVTPGSKTPVVEGVAAPVGSSPEKLLSPAPLKVEDDTVDPTGGTTEVGSPQQDLLLEEDRYSEEGRHSDENDSDNDQPDLLVSQGRESSSSTEPASPPPQEARILHNDRFSDRDDTVNLTSLATERTTPPARPPLGEYPYDNDDLIDDPPLDLLLPSERQQHYRELWQNTTVALSDLSAPTDCFVYPGLAAEILAAYLSHTTVSVPIWANYDASSQNFYLAPARLRDCGKLCLTPAQRAHVEALDAQGFRPRRVRLDIGTPFCTLFWVHVAVGSEDPREEEMPTLDVRANFLEHPWNPHNNLMVIVREAADRLREYCPRPGREQGLGLGDLDCFAEWFVYKPRTLRERRAFCDGVDAMDV